MRLLFAVLAFALFAGGVTPAAGRPALNCQLYAQLERRCGCAGTDNYLRAYGQKYCERVLRSTGWSTAGLAWRDRTLTCLKDELAREFAKSSQGCDCARIRSFAFESHVRCYTARAASVCALPLADIGRIYRIIDAADLLGPSGFKQALGVTLSCVWQNGNAGARGD